MRQRDFFATPNDLVPGLLALEARTPLRYIGYGIHDDEPLPYSSVVAIPDFGVRADKKVVAQRVFIVQPATAPVVVTPRIGRPGYRCDPTADSIVLEPGGYTLKRDLYNGRVFVNNEEFPDAVPLFRAFVRTVTRNFKWLYTDWFGPEALALLKAHRCRYSNMPEHPLTYLDG
jgi:hypothetical protein